MKNADTYKGRDKTRDKSGVKAKRRDARRAKAKRRAFESGAKGWR